MINKKLKLVFAIDSLVGGGAERVLTNLANHLDKEMYDISIVLTLGDKIDYNIDARINLIVLWKVPSNIPINIKSGFLVNFFDRVSRGSLTPFLEYARAFKVAADKFANLVKSLKPDVIVSFLPNTNNLVLEAKKVSHFTIPVICSDRNYLSLELQTLPYPLWYRSKIMRMYRLAALHVAVSKDAADDLRSRFHIPAKQIRTIYNGVDLIKIQNLSREEISPVHSEAMKSDGVLRIVSVGRLTKQKGHEYLIRALNGVKARVRWRLLLIGGGEEESKLKDIARELGIAENIYFLGWQQNPYSLMARCDLFVLSSLWEGFPNVLLEAMALGLPVVATRCQSGPEEILDGGKYGMLVPPMNVPALGNAIISCGTDSARREMMSQKSLERAREFTLSKMVQNYNEVIQAVIS
jgi:glycosyltransferase involved in cell wall biosynthesis